MIGARQRRLWNLIQMWWRQEQDARKRKRAVSLLMPRIQALARQYSPYIQVSQMADGNVVFEGPSGPRIGVSRDQLYALWCDDEYGKIDALARSISKGFDI